jgi:hypothetical protein
MQARLTRLIPAWRPSGERADRLVVLALSMVAFKASNSQFLSQHLPGRGAELANFILEYLAFLVFCVLTVLALRRPLASWVVRCKPHRLLAMSPLFAALALLVVLVTAVPPVVRGRQLVDDANAMAVCGARAIAAGADPYRVPEITCLRSLGVSPTLATPLKVGPLRNVAVYPTPAQIVAAASGPDRGGLRLFSPLGKPPLTPVAMVPVASLPLWARTVWTSIPVLILLLAMVLAAGPLWPAAGGLLLLTLFLNGSLVNFAANGNGETFAYVLMALSVLWIRRPVVSAVCLALAVGSNQLAWFFAPGYLLLVVEEGQVLRRLATGAATLLIAVVPWLIRYPDALGTIVGNLRAHTFPLGSGPITLVLAGYIPAPSRTLLLGLTGLAMLAIWAWGALAREYRVAASVLILAGFWLSWRSLDEYLAQIPLLALVALFSVLGRKAAEDVPAPT